MPEPISTGGVDTGAQFELSAEAKLALQNAGGLPRETVAREVAREAQASGVLLTPEQRARNELNDRLSPDTEIIRQFNIASKECIDQALAIEATRQNASGQVLISAERISQLNEEAETIQKDANTAYDRKTAAMAAEGHYSAAIANINFLLAVPRGDRPNLKDRFHITQETLNLLQTTTVDVLLSLSDEELALLLNETKDRANELNEKRAQAERDEQAHLNALAITQARRTTEIGVQTAHDGLEKATHAAFDEVASHVSKGRKAQKAFDDAVKAKSDIEAEIIRQFGTDILTNPTSIYAALDSLESVGSGTAEDQINALQLAISSKKGFLSIVTVDTTGNTTNALLSPEEISQEEAAITRLEAQLNSLKTIAGNVRENLSDRISLFGFDRSKLSDEDATILATKLEELAKAMEAKSSARKELEKAITDLGKVAEGAKQYNEAMQRSISETAADIERLKAEAEAEAAEQERLSREAEAAAAEQERQATIINSSEVGDLQARIRALESEGNQLREENLALAQTASQSLRERIAGNVKTFLRKNLRRIPRIRFEGR